jgi:hypothetical protein
MSARPNLRRADVAVAFDGYEKKFCALAGNARSGKSPKVCPALFRKTSRLTAPSQAGC